MEKVKACSPSPLLVLIVKLTYWKIFVVRVNVISGQKANITHFWGLVVRFRDRRSLFVFLL